MRLSARVHASGAVPFPQRTAGRTFVGGPMVAATVSFIVGVMGLLVFSLIFRQPWPLAEAVSRAPWWVWVGGLLGAFYVLATIVIVPRIGAATTVGLILVGQVTASLVIDHFGLISVPIHGLNPPRVLGAALIVVGVALVQRF